MKANSVLEKAILPAVVSLSVWLQQIGVTACTAWRWRKKGWLITINIAGRQYLTQEGITEFTDRAKRGDFAQVPVVPKRIEVISGISCAITVPTQVEGQPVTGLGFAAFLYSSVTSVVVPSGVTSICSAAFEGCGRLTRIYFLGNALDFGGNVFDLDDNLTAYYLPGTSGWGSTLAGVPAVLWNPLIQTSDGSFGISNSQFGFNITGTADIPIVVEASTNLASPTWTVLESFTLTNGSFYFSDAQWTIFPGRFYRFSSP